VLIVEDDPSLRTLYQRVLTLEGYAVLSAEDGLDALQRAEGRSIDAVILDLTMPRLDGRSVRRDFAANANMRNVPIILVTGQLAPDIDSDDFACVLHKPISIDELRKAVRDCIEEHRANS